MNQVIEYDKNIYALLSQHLDVSSNKTEWFGKETESLQGSRMCYDKDKSFKTHLHKLNPRIINRTQEVFVVISGSIQIEIFIKEKPDSLFNGYTDINGDIVKSIGILTAKAGDILFVWRGYHKLTVLEDNTVCYEIKAGSFNSVQEDKEFLPDVD